MKLKWPLHMALCNKQLQCEMQSNNMPDIFPISLEDLQ